MFYLPESCQRTELVFALAKSGHPTSRMHFERGIYSKRTGNAGVWQTEHAQ